MTKILVQDKLENTTVPFLRGVLVHSLHDIGLPFKQAHLIASQLRDELAGERLISTDALAARVEQALSDAGSADLLAAYRQRKLPHRVEVTTAADEAIEYSRSVCRKSLEGIGLTRDEAIDIERRVSEHLWRSGVRQVSSAEISAIIYELLSNASALGPAVARRWLIWRDFINSGRPLVLLIGGTVGSGKSSVAADVASRLDIVRTQSTDMLREVMRAMTTPDSEPMLHASSFRAWRALPEEEDGASWSRESRVVKGYHCQADRLTAAIDAVVRRAEYEHVSLILEGVHLRPKLIEALNDTTDAVVVPVVLAVIKRKVLQRRLRGRGSRAPGRLAAHYLKSFDDIWHLQSNILVEAEQAGINIIPNDSREQVFREIMLRIIEVLSAPEKTCG